MARFVLIDQSLTGVEGHHYEYDVNIVKAAESAGYEPILVCNRSFDPPAEVSDRWRTVPAFDYSSYSQYTIFCGESSRPPDFRKPLAKPFHARPFGFRLLGALFDIRNRLRDLRYENRRQRRVRLFVESCREFWEEVAPTPDDVLFFPTMTEFDFECLSSFLAETPATRDHEWHLQFHFNYMEGREPEYEGQQPRFKAMQQHFRRQLDRIPQHRLHVYTTSQPLAEQYNLLGIARFQALPYPVNTALSPAANAASSRPLKATCAGCVRPEKGHHHLSPLVETLWDDYFGAGRMQLVLQTEEGRNPIALPKRATDEQADQAVQCIPFPLPRPDYMELVRQTDIGMLMYDSRRYYARCSGVLVEMLSAGVPVVVPAGCWLGEQLADAVNSHQSQVIEQLKTLSSQSCGGLSLSANRDWETCVPAGKSADERYLAVRLRWREPSAGRYVRLIATAAGSGSGDWKREFVVGRWTDAPGNATPVLIPLPAGISDVRLQVQTAFDGAKVELENLAFSVLAGGRVPVAAVGIVAASHAEFAYGLREIADHHAHYRRTATSFAAGWKHAHEPLATIERLQQAAAGAASRAVSTAGARAA